MRGGKIPKDHAEEVADCFTAYAQDLFGYACVVTRGDSALADDLVQSAFIEAARQWPTMRCLRDAQRVRWLQTTVSYQAIRVFRRNNAMRGYLPRLEAPVRAASLLSVCSLVIVAASRRVIRPLSLSLVLIGAIASIGVPRWSGSSWGGAGHACAA